MPTCEYFIPKVDKDRWVTGKSGREREEEIRDKGEEGKKLGLLL